MIINFNIIFIILGGVDGAEGDAGDGVAIPPTSFFAFAFFRSARISPICLYILPRIA